MVTSRVLLPIVLAALVVVERPTYLVVLDGAPRTARVGGTDFRRVVNTKSLLLADGERFYLDVAGKWMGAPSLAGPWAFAVGSLSRLDMAREVAAAGGAAFEGPPEAVLAALERLAVPDVRVAIEPTALVVVRGEPKLARIRGTALRWVKNSDGAVFFDDGGATWYAFADRAWYRSKSLAGPWESIAAAALPEDFLRIPPDHPRASLLGAPR